MPGTASTSPSTSYGEGAVPKINAELCTGEKMIHALFIWLATHDFDPLKSSLSDTRKATTPLASLFGFRPQ